MIIDDAIVRWCAEKTKEIIRDYEVNCAGPGDTYRSVDDLGTLIAARRFKPIRYRRLLQDRPDPLVRACYMDHGHYIGIYTPPGLALPVLRYYMCREIFHVVLDQEAFRTTDITDLIDKMIFRASPECSGLGLRRSTNAETIAEIAAAEFLLPFEDRRTIRRTHGEIDLPAIAARYVVPQWLVEFLLSNAHMRAVGPFFEAALRAEEEEVA